MKRWMCLGVLLVGCTDYDFKSLEGSEPGADDTGVPNDSIGDNDGTTSNDTNDTQDPNNETDDDDDCTEAVVAFNIDEVSTLQDAVSYSVAGWSQDAVVISFDDSTLAPDQRWRVSAVEVLVLIADAYYPYFVDGDEMNIQVFDAPDPFDAPDWTVTKGIVRSEHTWTSYTLPYDAYHASLYGEYAQQGAWVRFDTTSIIPTTGMNSTDFLVGVMWEPPGMVKVGYSNFNQSCEVNWSNYGSGWVLNSENADYYGCSWPMMRVEVEIITDGDC